MPPSRAGCTARKFSQTTQRVFTGFRIERRRFKMILLDHRLCLAGEIKGYCIHDPRSCTLGQRAHDKFRVSGNDD